MQYASNLAFISRVAEIEESIEDYTHCTNCKKAPKHNCLTKAKEGDCQFYNTHKDEHFNEEK